jgi:hypothetical protein
LTDLVERGIAAVRSGDKLTARGLLVRAILADPRDVDAWMWLSAAVNTDEERLACLVKVLEIKPGHDAARRGAAALRRQGVGLPSSAEGAGPEAGPDGVRTGAGATTPSGDARRRSLDHSRAFSQLEPRRRHALRGYSRLVRRQLGEGRKRREVVDELAGRGFPQAAVEELVDDIARPLNVENLKRYRKQVLRGGLVVAGGLVVSIVLRLAQVDLAAAYYALYGVIAYGVVELAAGAIGWLWHRV